MQWSRSRHTELSRSMVCFVLIVQGSMALLSNDTYVFENPLFQEWPTQRIPPPPPRAVKKIII